MDLDYIAQQLNNNIDPASRRLSLPISVDLGAPIKLLFEQYLLGGPLILNEALVTMQQGQNRVLLTGTGASFPFETLTIRAYFSVAPAGAAAVLDLIGNAGKLWNFAVAFPALAPTFMPTLSFASAAFTLRSLEEPDKPAGLSFAGILKMDGELSFLQPLLNETQLDVSSPITLEANLPKIRLTENYFLVTPGIGTFAPFHVRLVAATDPTPDGDIIPTFAIQGVLTFGDARELSIGYDLLTIIPGYYHFVADFREADLTFGNLASLLNGSDPAPALPAVFSVLNNFEFKTWEIYIGASGFSVANVVISVGTKQPWELLPNHLLDLNLDYLTLDVQNTGKLAVYCDVQATFTLKQQEVPAVIMLRASYPGFKFSGKLIGGYLDIPYLIGRYISETAAELVPTSLRVDGLYLAIDPTTSSYAFSIDTKAEWAIKIADVRFTVLQISFDISRVAQATSGRFKGAFRLGSIEPPILVDVAAGYTTAGGWTFEGGLTEGSKVTFNDILNSYFPDWNLESMVVTLEAFRVSYSAKTGAYRFQIKVLWVLEFLGWTATLQGECDIAYTEQKTYQGFIRGTLDIEGFLLSAEVTYPDKTVTLKLGDLKIEFKGDPVVITIYFPSITLGEIITTLVTAAVGENITLPAPWNVLNLINLKDLVLRITPSKQIFEAEYSPNLNLGFVSIEKFVLRYTGGQGSANSKVEFAITAGSFLGQPIDPADPVKMNVLEPASAPKVPGAGDTVFALHFLAIGQRVALKDPVNAKTVTQAMEIVEKAFYKQQDEEGSPVAGTGLVPSERSSWIFAIRAEILSSITIRALFFDPDLYGVGINVGGTKFPSFTGLNFEILYKKINENVGVYQIELKLPDVMRQLEFGSVSITLPIIALDIYTNGDFLIDFGFPANGDFTRSFAIQVLPFTGAGGFYFGVLSNATAKRLPPGPLCGSFSPVIEAGVGLRIGLGKDINKGVLKAGLSLTVQGIIEGTLAFYNDNLQRPEYDDAVFYYISGQVSIVGQIYGEINFAIISARLDVLIRIGVTFVMQALDPIVLGFFAEITVSVSVKINLGIFKITISLSFSATFRESFTIGSVSSKPWYICPSSTQPRAIRARRTALDVFDPGCENVQLVFHAVTRTTPQDVQVLFVPQFTPASDVNGGVQPSKARCVATFNIETSTGESSHVETAFDRLARGVFLWTLAAYLFPEPKSTPEEDVLSQEITLTQLEKLYCALTRTSASLLFDEIQLSGFFAAYFKFIVSLAEEQADARITTIFPVLTPFILVPPTGPQIPFASWRMVSSQYLAAIKKYFEPMQVDYLSPEEKAAKAARAAAAPPEPGDKSLACWMMLDYFTLLVKDTTQAAIDTMTAMTITVGEGATLASILARYPGSGATVEELVWANATTPLSHNASVRLGAPMGAEYRVNANGPSTLFGIGRHHHVPLDELARTNQDAPGLFPAGRRIWFPLIDSIKVSELLTAMQDQSAFEHLAGSASRVLLSGLRPPAPSDGPLTPLYELNGQQFDASTLQVGSSFSLKINTELKWLVFAKPPSDPLSLPVVISTDEASVIAAFNTAKLDPQIQSLQPMDLYKVEPKSFGVGNATLWQLAEDPVNRSIWMLPQNLQTMLFDNPDARPQVELWESIQKNPNQAPQPIKVPSAEYAWTSRIDVVVRRIRTRTGDLVPNTYEMRGAGVAFSTVLQNLLTYATPDPVSDLHILYLPDPLGDFQGLLSPAVADTQIFLLQTNLSTEANPELFFASTAAVLNTSYITGMTALDVLKYVWEGSVVRSGGYYLYYKQVASSEGLPEYLFNDTEETTVTLLVTLNPAAAGLWPYMNSLLITREMDIQNTAFYLKAIGPELVERVPTIGPGLNGFNIQRTAPVTPDLSGAITAQVATPFISELYNLLNFHIADFGGFDSSPFAMPATPADVTDPDPDPNADRTPRLETDYWNYQAVAPIYRFSKVIPPPPPDLPEPLPSPEKNPYRGIGSDVRFELSWLDLFGNRIETQNTGPQPSLDIPVRYFDNLIPIDKWPAVSTDFIVKKGASAAQLDVNLRFDACRYLPPSSGGTNEDYKSIALADRPTYELIYYQLTQSGVSATVSSTFDSAQTPCIKPLVEYAVSIYQFLNAIIGNSSWTIPADKIITFAPQDSNPLQYYQLLVSISIERPAGQIHAQLQDPPFDPVRRVSSFVPAHYTETPTDDPKEKPLTLRAFVEQLELAFPNLAVATAKPRVSSNAENTLKEIWVVRFGGTNGIVYDVKQPAFYFAPLPLSRTLQSTAVSLYSYSSGKPIDQGTPQSYSFSGVDMDLLAKTFLETVDLVLSPQFVVPAWLALNEQEPNAPGPNAIERILSNKKDLAGAIAERIASVLVEQQGVGKNLEAATAKLRQQLLIRLSDLYSVHCIVQFNVSIDSGFTDESTAPRLFGHPGPKQAIPAPGAQTQDYSFSTAEISLCNKPGASLLTFLFGTRDPSAAKNVTLEMAYQRSNLQHGFSTIPGIPDYEASSWLAFYQLEQAEPAVASQSGRTDLGVVTVPVPLRAYPPAPVLLEQRGLEQELITLPAAGNPVLELTKRWVFEFTWTYDLAEQDTLYSDVQFNVPGGKAAFLKAAPTLDLLGALLQFSTVYSDVLHDLEDSLIATYKPELATVTLNSLAWLIQLVSTAWSAGPQAKTALFVLPEVLTANLRITQAAATVSGVAYPVFSVTVECETDGRPLEPTVSLPGFKAVPLPKPAAGNTTKTYAYLDAQNEYLPYAAGAAIHTRGIRFENMNILDEQTGWAGLHIRRNEVLVEGKETNPKFIYETPDLRFASVLTPLLNPDVPINIADSSASKPASDKLYHYLFNFLSDFFGSAPDAGGTIKFGGNFVYDLNAGAGPVPLPVSLPVWMTLPTQVTTGTATPPEVTIQAFSRSLADFIVSWFADRGLTGRIGQLAVQLFLYSALAGSNLPVLELQQLYLETELIW